MKLRYKKYLLTGIRIVLGIVFLLSGVGKLLDSGYVNYDLIRLLSSKFFWIIEYAAPIIILISIIELIICILLLWGKKLRWTLSAALIMLLAFTSVMVSYYIQGMTIQSCGCFGALGIGSGFLFGIIKNIVLIALIIAAFVLIKKTSTKVAPVGRN